MLTTVQVLVTKMQKHVVGMEVPRFVEVEFPQESVVY